MKNNDASNIWDLYLVSRRHRKPSALNKIIIFVLGASGALVGWRAQAISGEEFRSFLNVLLALNGSILGLAIAGFSLTIAIPRDVLTIMNSSKAPDYPWSFFKQVLLNYVYIFVALLSAVSFFVLEYSLSFLGDEIAGNSYRQLMSFALSVTLFFQGWVIAELKSFLYWIYDNNLMIGQAVTIQDNLQPYDEPELDG